VGRVIVNHLVESNFRVTIGTRESAKLEGMPTEVTAKTIDYSNPESLLVAFNGQDAIVEAFNPSVSVYQAQILSAAIESGVRHIITPDFSSDTFNPHVEELLIFGPKLEAQCVLDNVASTGKLSWTAIIVGPLFDWGMCSITSALISLMEP
jgi:saccharopine dehydrogenase-like NADP-dependent oxidoreductase